MALSLLIAFVIHDVALGALPREDFINAADAGQSIIDAQAEVSKDFDKSVTDTMKTVIESSIFKAAATLGVTFALFGFAPVAMESVRAYHADQPIDREFFLKKLFILGLICLMLGAPTSRGLLLGDTLISLNGAMNFWSGKILKAAGGENGIQAISQKVIQDRANTKATEGLTECAKIPEQGARNDCFKAVHFQVLDILEPFLEEQWARRTSVLIQGRIIDAAEIETSYGSEGFISKLLGLPGDAFQETQLRMIEGICWLMGRAFVATIEHIKIIMVVVAPLFLGLSAMSLFQGSFGTWFTSFVLVEFAHTTFNLVLSLVAITLLTSESGGALIFPFTVALVSIGLGLGLVTGGGVALFQVGSGAIRTGASIIRR